MFRLLIMSCLFAVLVIAGCTGCKGKEEPPSTVTAPPAEVKEQQAGSAETSAQQEPEVRGGSTDTTANKPPRISVFNINPRIPVIGDRVKAEVTATDKEGDDLTLVYHWSKNDEPLPEESAELYLSPSKFKRGDKITLKVLASDGKMTGSPVTMYITIANAAPVIKSSQETVRFDGSNYSYQIKASDPDGDPLSYSLKAGPQGMTVSSEGLIQWRVPAGYEGNAPVTVSVTDGQGGETLQSFTVEIR